MSLIDLKDVYFSVTTHRDHQKYIKVLFNYFFQFT